jgi:cholesterol transport system auxiliary component
MTIPAARSVQMTSSLVITTLVLTACVGGLLDSNQQAPESYRLATPAAPTSAGAANAARPATLAIVVARLRAPSSLDTDRIAIVEAGRRFDYYAGVRWSEAAPQMLQQNVVAALTNSGAFAGVYAAPSRVPAELLLDIELRRFEADTAAAGPPVAHVQVQASLVDSRRSDRVASFVSDAAVGAAANRRADIIDAFDRASAQVVSDVVARVAAASAQLPQPSTSP